MTRMELTKIVADGLGLSKTTVDAVIADVLDVIQKTDSVLFRGFGKFTNVKRGAKEYRNPSTGGKVLVPACTVLKFKASKHGE